MAKKIVSTVESFVVGLKRINGRVVEWTDGSSTPLKACVTVQTRLMSSPDEYTLKFQAELAGDSYVVTLYKGDAKSRAVALLDRLSAETPGYLTLSGVKVPAAVKT